MTRGDIKSKEFAVPEKDASGEIVIISLKIEEVRPCEDQIRRFFDDEKIRQLAMGLQISGQVEPVKVYRLPEGEDHKYELIDGERRYRAHLLAGRETISAVIYTISGREALDRTQIISNMNRESHTPMEMARAILLLKGHGDSLEEIAEQLGCSVSSVSNYLLLNNLHPELQRRVEPSEPKATRISPTAAIKLAVLSPAKQIQAFQRAQAHAASSARKLRVHDVQAAVEGELRTNPESRHRNVSYRAGGARRRDGHHVRESLDLNLERLLVTFEKYGEVDWKSVFAVSHEALLLQVIRKGVGVRDELNRLLAELDQILQGKYELLGKEAPYLGVPRE
ncbi:MAG: ParB/RepB/Spo0J family partition protein [Deltaproteobacteria bacterium]|nr:ParB/RepB/Spo0J family partition protein [Deltaproteobacteria bacterium]